MSRITTEVTVHPHGREKKCKAETTGWWCGVCNNGMLSMNPEIGDTCGGCGAVVVGVATKLEGNPEDYPNLTDRSLTKYK